MDGGQSRAKLVRSPVRTAEIASSNRLTPASTPASDVLQGTLSRRTGLPAPHLQPWQAVSVPIDESEIRPHIARLRDSIDDELRTQFGMRDIDIPVDTLLEIAYWVAVQLDYAYEFEWKPRWEGGRQ